MKEPRAVACNQRVSKLGVLFCGVPIVILKDGIWGPYLGAIVWLTPCTSPRKLVPQLCRLKIMSELAYSYFA